MSWDPFQREMLAELGLQPWVPAIRDRVASMPAAGETAAARIPPALLEALARAAACDAATIATLPGIDAACAGAAGKRALWPRLRRLRAGQG